MTINISRHFGKTFTTRRTRRNVIRHFKPLIFLTIKLDLKKIKKKIKIQTFDFLVELCSDWH